MKILIGQSYFRVLDPKELKRKMPYPPLGPLYITTLLDDLGYQVHFFDSMLASNVNQFLDLIIQVKPDVLLIYDDEFNYLTKMCLSNMRYAALDIIKFAKQQEIPVIVYSSDAIDHSDIYLENGCDIVIIGEAEDTIVEIFNNFDPKKFPSILKSITGIKYLDSSSNLVFTGNRKLISNLDKLPDPNYDYVNIEEYRKIWLKNHKYFSMNISTTRGCPYNCNWCAKPLYGRTYAMRSPDRVIDQIQFLKIKYNVDHIWFTDDIFALKRSWLKEFSHVIKKRKIDIKFKCLSRADLLVKDNVSKLLKEAGCEIVWIGAESGSQKILDAMDKDIKVEEIYESTRKLKSQNINVAYFIQFGYLGETWDDILLTRKLIKDTIPDDIGISVSYPLPGTKFYNHVKSFMSEKRNWIDSDDFELMYTGTYPKSFYKNLHRFIHAEYNLNKIIKKRKIRKIPIIPFYLFRYVIFRLKIESHLRNKNSSFDVDSNIIPLID